MLPFLLIFLAVKWLVIAFHMYVLKNHLTYGMLCYHLHWLPRNTGNISHKIGCVCREDRNTTTLWTKKWPTMGQTGDGWQPCLLFVVLCKLVQINNLQIKRSPFIRLVSRLSSLSYSDDEIQNSSSGRELERHWSTLFMKHCTRATVQY